METITTLMPQSFIDCKMEKVVLIGDCKDHRVESIRNSIVASADQHSSKSDASVAMGQQWCTPTGFVAAACDLVCTSRPLPPPLLASVGWHWLLTEGCWAHLRAERITGDGQAHL